MSLGDDRSPRTNRSVRGSLASAFSLAELMIALIILGLGLLFIAAALPVGLSYTRDTIDLAAGEAAAHYALRTLERELRTASELVYTAGDGTEQRSDNLFRPRENSPPTYPLADGDPEPWIRVRPLVMSNIVAGPAAGFQRGDELAYDVENQTVGRWFEAVGMIPANPLAEYDALPPHKSLRLAQQPGLPSVVRAYPPITPDQPFTLEGFFADRYAERPVFGPNTTPDGVETLKALERRLVWTAFYRRVSYLQPGPDGTMGTSDDLPGDPLLYELIVVVVRRPSVNHRFALQDAGGGSFTSPRAAGGPELLAPEPWLVAFERLDLLDSSEYDQRPGSGRVITDLSFAERPALRFGCSEELGRLLPVGSIFIPAVNRSDGTAVGFVPHAPDACPVYRVRQRPDERTVVVQSNGFYPWVASQNPGDGLAWPVWVIPPAFRERDSAGQPVYERRSPIVAVARRFIRVHEARP